MRSILLFLPVILMAQTTPPKAPAATPKAPATQTKAPAATTPSTAKPAGTGAATTALKPPAPKPVVPAAAPLTTDEQKTIYCIGLSISQNLTQLDLSPAELDLIKRALTDAAAKKPAVELKEWGPKMDAFAASRRAG